MARLLVVDIETLDMAPPAALIEIGWCSLDTDSMFAGETSGNELFGIPEGQTMQPDNRAIHHIDPASLEGRALWDNSFISDVFMAAPAPLIDYFVAHNSEFESQWIDPGVPWICTYKVALRLVPDARSHSNQSLKYELGIGDVPAHHPPHRALSDCIVTALILERLIEIALARNPDLSVRSILERMATITTEPRFFKNCPIGEHKGKPWAQVDTGFLNWYVNKATRTDPDTLWNVNRELTRRRRGDGPDKGRSLMNDQDMHG